MTATDITEGFLGIIKYPAMPMTNSAPTAYCQIGIDFSNLAETSDSFVAGRLCDMIQNTSTFCPTPLSFGFPMNFFQNHVLRF